MNKIFKNFKRKQNKEERYHYKTLVPTDKSDAKETLYMLEDVMASPDTTNIALSGKYGAGKSSIIKTFFKIHKEKEYKPLFISLGMLGISNVSKDSESKEIFSQEIEKSIIQQILYKERPAKLKDSMIKRIDKLSFREISKVFFLIIVILIFIFFLIYKVNLVSGIKLIIKNVLNIKNLNILLIFKIILYLIVGIVAIVITFGISYLVARFIKNLNIKSYKVKIPNTEIEINRDINESLLSKYMDEIVYFFSKTKYNVLVIEDLDRFLNCEDIKEKVLIIFQKLKELNFILNNSKQIKRRRKRKIKFLYAVKDDLFCNATERTKFFDAIVPVIPVVSNFNSYAKLKENLKDENISDQLMQDMSVYIDDARLLKNIINEFHLYKKQLNNLENNVTKNEKIFAMVSLKNIRPKEYEMLLNNEGKIFGLLENKEEMYNFLKSNLNKEIEENNTNIEKLKKENLKNLKELKILTLGKALIEGEKVRYTYNDNAILIDQFLKDNIDKEYIESNNIIIRDNSGYYYEEATIFKYCGGKTEFIKRAEKIDEKNNMGIKKIEIQNSVIKEKIKRINELSLYEILESLDKEKIKSMLSKKSKEGDEEEINEEDNKTIIDPFLLMLVSNGYIDENYKNYMFYFKETEDIKINDYNYIISVRQGILKEFNYKIENKVAVINKLNVKYFGRKVIFNYEILDELLVNKDLINQEEKLNRFLSVLVEVNEFTQKFIFGFLKHTLNKEIFIEKIYKIDNQFIKRFILYNVKNNEKFDYLIKILLDCPIILLNVKKEYDCIEIKKYIDKKSDFENWVELNDNIEKSLCFLNIKFANIEKITNAKFMEYIYNKNLYKLNDKMIKLIFYYKGYSEDDFKSRNLTCILKNENLQKLKKYVLENQQEYIENCYLKTNNLKNDINDIYICINDWDQLSIQYKNKIIDNMPRLINDIKDISILESDDYILENNKIKPTWNNLYNMYLRKENKIDDVLVKYIEMNIENIIMDKIDESQNTIEFNGFLEKIIRNNDINYNCYNKIIKHISYIKLKEIKNKEINKDRLKILIESNMIEISVENFNVINQEMSEILDVYVNNDLDEFIYRIGEYNLNYDNIEILIKSNKIKSKFKSDILYKIGDDLLNDNAIIYIVENYSYKGIRNLPESVKRKIFISNIDLEYKILFLNKEIQKENNVEIIKEYMSNMPEPYNLIGNYELETKQFTILNNKDNLKLLENLINKGFNFKFRPSEKKIKLIINNLKNK